VTEAEWLTVNDPVRMLKFLRCKVSERMVICSSASLTSTKLPEIACKRSAGPGIGRRP
jgi:hypothetical protein